MHVFIVVSVTPHTYRNDIFRPYKRPLIDIISDSIVLINNNAAITAHMYSTKNLVDKYIQRMTEYSIIKP